MENNLQRVWERIKEHLDNTEWQEEDNEKFIIISPTNLPNLKNSFIATLYYYEEALDIY